MEWSKVDSLEDIKLICDSIPSKYDGAEQMKNLFNNYLKKKEKFDSFEVFIVCSKSKTLKAVLVRVNKEK